MSRPDFKSREPQQVSVPFPSNQWVSTERIVHILLGSGGFVLTEAYPNGLIDIKYTPTFDDLTGAVYDFVLSTEDEEPDFKVQPTKDGQGVSIRMQPSDNKVSILTIRSKYGLQSFVQELSDYLEDENLHHLNQSFQYLLKRSAPVPRGQSAAGAAGVRPTSGVKQKQLKRY